MLTPAQVVFDYFVSQPEGTELIRDDIAKSLSAFPKSHMMGAISQLKSAGVLIAKQGRYRLMEFARRPIARACSIDYHDISSRGYEAQELKRNFNIYERLNQ